MITVNTCTKASGRVVYSLKDGQTLLGDVLDREDAQAIADRINRPDMTALSNIREMCEAGLNSEDPKHWEAALQDIMQLCDTPDAWGPDDSEAAAEEGWGLYSVDRDGFAYLDLQKCDDSETFGEDGQAIAWVFWKATAGSELHAKAIRICTAPGNRAPQPVWKAVRA